MKTEEIIKATQEWHESDERRAAIVILIDDAEKDGYSKYAGAILGKNGRIVAGLKSLMKESEIFSQIVKRAQLGCCIEEITK